MAYIKRVFTQGKDRIVYLYKNKKPVFFGLVALIIAAIVAMIVFSGNGEETPEEATKAVEVASVSSLSSGEAGLLLVGEVRAASQADLRAETTGRVVRVNAKLGSQVPAGTIIAEMENSSERARVLSAQGSLAQAQANYDLVRNGARPEDRASAAAASQSAQGSLAEAKNSAVRAYKEAYSASQSAIEGKADNFFRKSETINPDLLPTAKEYATAQAVEQKRAQYNTLLKTWAQESATISPNTDLDARLSVANSRLQDIKAFLDSITAVVAAQNTQVVTQETINAQLAILNAARTEIDGSIAAVSGAKTALYNASSAQTSAQAQVTTIDAGAREEEIRTAQAAVTQARGSLAAAQADLDKTRARTPIAGVVSALSVQSGDFISNGQPIAIITNDQGNSYLVETYITPADRAVVMPGAQVTIEGMATGTVATVAPGVDPTTQKVKVEITLSNLPQEIAPGQTVRLSVDTTPQNGENGEGETVAKQVLSLPLSALKLTPDGAYVFTVNASSTLSAVPVELGPLTGDRASVVSGLTPDMLILTDARGHREGEAVTVVQ